MCPRSSHRYHIDSAMSLSELTDLSMTEINNYHRGGPYNEQYYLEIFHSALVQHDPDAWELLQERFNPIVRAWMYKHPRSDIVRCYEPLEYFVNHTFTRVWQSSLRITLEFDTLSAALSYLKLSLQGVVIDTLRVYSRPDCAPLPISGSGPDTCYIEEPATEDTYESSAGWDIIKDLLLNERERRLAYLIYHCNLKPGEIVCNYPEEFSNIQEIYRLTRNILERFMRNRDQSCWRL